MSSKVDLRRDLKEKRSSLSKTAQSSRFGLLHCRKVGRFLCRRDLPLPQAVGFQGVVGVGISTTKGPSWWARISVAKGLALEG